MSSLSEKLENARATESSVARATLAHLRNRRGVELTDDPDPLVVVVRAPSQTEFWSRETKGSYVLDKRVSESGKPVLLVPDVE